MNNDANLADRELLDEDYLIIDRMPIVSDDGYVERTYAVDYDLDDDSGIGDESTTGTRSTGGAVGTRNTAGLRRTSTPVSQLAGFFLIRLARIACSYYCCVPYDSRLS